MTNKNEKGNKSIQKVTVMPASDGVHHDFLSRFLHLCLLGRQAVEFQTKTHYEPRHRPLKSLTYWVSFEFFPMSRRNQRVRSQEFCHGFAKWGRCYSVAKYSSLTIRWYIESQGKFLISKNFPFWPIHHRYHTHTHTLKRLT